MTDVTVKAPLKMYAVFRPEALKAMKGVRGKLTSQAGHAFTHTGWDTEDRFPEIHKAYRASAHAYKISLAAPEGVDESWYDNLLTLYRDKCGVTKVIDAGFTVFDGPTLTAIGIGPISPDDREDILRGLKPLT